MKNRLNKRWRVLLTGPLHEKAQKILESRAEVDLVPLYSSTEKIINLMQKQQTEVLIVRAGKISREVLIASPRLRVIVKHGVGYDNIDVKSATELGLPVLATPMANFESVAEHTLALIFALFKKLTLLDYEIKTKKEWPKTKYTMNELQHKCLGVVGFGRVGSKLVQLVSPLKMGILVYDPFVSEKNLPQEIQKVKSIKELTQKSDIVSIHCPLTKETYHLFGEEELNSMKSTAYLINTARGKIVDEVALIKALEKGLIAGAGLDTFEQEPLSPDNLLLKLDNVIVTPHVAGTTKESFIRMGVTAVKLAFQILEGKEEDIPVDNFINREVLEKK